MIQNMLLQTYEILLKHCVSIVNSTTVRVAKKYKIYAKTVGFEPESKYG